MKVYIQKGLETECWGNYTCKLKFTSESKILYAKDVSYQNFDNINIENRYYYIKLEKCSSVLICEFDRRTGLWDLVCIDFEKMQIKRLNRNPNLIGKLMKMSDLEKIEFINREFCHDEFIIETVELPFWKRWKKEYLFEIPPR